MSKRKPEQKTQLDRIALMSARNKLAQEATKNHLLRSRPRLAIVYDRLMEAVNITDGFYVSYFNDSFLQLELESFDVSNETKLITNIDKVSESINSIKNDFERILLRLENQDVKKDLEEGLSELENQVASLRSLHQTFIGSILCVPIGLSACVETYFKKIYAELIDKNILNARKNAVNLISRKDIRIEALLYLDEKGFTVGDVFSSLLWSRDIRDLNSNINTLLGNNIDYASEVSKQLRDNVLAKSEIVLVREQDAVLREMGQANLLESLEYDMEDYYSKTYKYLCETFSTDFQYGQLEEKISILFDFRNRICHESYTVVSGNDYGEFKSFVTCVKALLWASEFIFSPLLD